MGEMSLDRAARHIQPVPDLGIRQSLGYQTGHGLLGRGEALPAELRAAARPAAAPPDTRVAQYRLGPGEIARGAKPLVDLKGVLNQGPTAVSIFTLGESGARVFGGSCELQRPGALGVSSDGHLKDLGIVVSQSPAVQRSACK